MSFKRELGNKQIDRSCKTCDNYRSYYCKKFHRLTDPHLKNLGCWESFEVRRKQNGKRTLC